MAAGQFLVPLMSGFVITVIFMPLFIGYLRFKKKRGRQSVKKAPNGTLRKMGHQQWAGSYSLLPLLFQVFG